MGNKTIYTVEQLKEIATMKDCTELKKMIIENPDAPLLIFAGEEAYAYEDYPYTCCDPASPVLEELTLYNDEVWMPKDELQEKLEYDLCDAEEYENLSDDEYYKKIEEIVDNTPFIKAIVIRVG